MKSGENGVGRQPTGRRFIEIREDLHRMAGGVLGDAAMPTEQKTEQKTVDRPQINVPQAESSNEPAHELVNLDKQFVIVADENMNIVLNAIGVATDSGQLMQTY